MTCDSHSYSIDDSKGPWKADGRLQGKHTLSTLLPRTCQTCRTCRIASHRLLQSTFHKGGVARNAQCRIYVMLFRKGRGCGIGRERGRERGQGREPGSRRGCGSGVQSPLFYSNFKVERFEGEQENDLSLKSLRKSAR
jgi:hypothetical protein